MILGHNWKGSNERRCNQLIWLCKFRSQIRENLTHAQHRWSLPNEQMSLKAGFILMCILLITDQASHKWNAIKWNPMTHLFQKTIRSAKKLGTKWTNFILHSVQDRRKYVCSRKHHPQNISQPYHHAFIKKSADQRLYLAKIMHESHLIVPCTCLCKF